MTADKIAEEIFNEGIKFAQGRSHKRDIFNTELIKQYGKEKCKEQRNLCASQFIQEYESQICYNAPEPEFD